MSTNIHTIYIDASEEITTVIERLKGSHESIVALVIPKGAALTQSIVNLKLIRRAAQDAAKDVILVTTDKIGRNLATQVGIPVATNEKEITNVARGGSDGSEEEVPVIAGVRIHRYYKEDEEPDTNEEAPTQTPSVIVPKELLQKQKETKESNLPMERPEISVPMVTEPAAMPLVVPQDEVMPSESEPIMTVNEAVLAADTIVTETPPTTPVTTEPLQRKNIDNPVIETVLPSTSKTTSETMKSELKPKRRRWIGATALFLVLLLIAGAAVSFLFLPKTSLVLTVKAQPLSQDITLSAKPNSSSTDGSLAAQVITSSSSITTTFNATGTKTIGNQAAGVATIYNQGSTTAQSVPSGTVVTASGKAFTTQSAVTVPGYTQAGIGKPLVPGQATVNVTANDPGTDGNMTNGAISGTIASNPNLTGTVTASGGTSQDVTVITATDIANAKNAAMKQLQDDLLKKTTDQIGAKDVQYALNSDVVSIGTFTATQAAGDQVATAQGTVQGTLERTIVDTSLVKQAAADQVKQAETAAEQRLVEATNVTSVTYNKNDKSLSLIAHVDGKITPVFTTDSLPANLKGHTVDAAIQFVKGTTPASTVTITQSPSWWPLKQLPTFAKYITIVTKYE